MKWTIINTNAKYLGVISHSVKKVAWNITLNTTIIKRTKLELREKSQVGITKSTSILII